jgi:hypothetical protein
LATALLITGLSACDASDPDPARADDAAAGAGDSMSADDATAPDAPARGGAPAAADSGVPPGAMPDGGNAVPDATATGGNPIAPDAGTSTEHASCGSDPRDLVVAEPLGDWTCSIYPFEDALWMLQSWQGQKLFDYRLGGAGVIAEMRDVQATYAALLSPSFKGEMTDRVIQYVAWDLKTLNPGVPGLDREFEWRFNITQAGRSDNVFAPTVEVRIDQAKCLVDVYSVPHNQWYPQQEFYFSSKLPTLTRYQFVANGDLLVRRVVMTTEFLFKGERRDFQQLLFDAWTPFAKARFNAVARSFLPDGTLGWWEVSANFETYPSFPVDQSSGYAAVVKHPSPEKHTAIGWVFGTKQPCAGPGCDGPNAGVYVYNQMQWDTGFALIPDWDFKAPVGPGLVLDQTFYLVPAKGADAYFLSRLQARVGQTPAPRVLTRQEAFTTDLCAIVKKLDVIANDPGVPTEKLWPLVR